MEIRPRLSEDEYDIVQKYRAIIKASEQADINPDDVKHGWLKSQKASLFFTNPNYEKPSFDIKEINWDEIIKPLEYKNNTLDVISEAFFDRLIITDCHIGMDVNKDGFSLYGGKWDEEELFNRLENVLNVVSLNKKSSHLDLADLGDLMDGWNGLTVRKQHDLPQNMDNQKAFDTAVKFKLNLLKELSKHYETITVRNVCTDNHSGAFGYVVNSAIKHLFTNYTNIEVINYRKFIDHYNYGKYTFIVCHGKDDKNLKFSFPLHLDSKGQEKINSYIDENYLFQKGVKIEFSKGDSHQMLFDYCTSDRFNYFNYPSFSPASNWIQTNYKKSRSGFVFFNYYEDRINYFPYWFKWIKQ